MHEDLQNTIGKVGEEYIELDNTPVLSKIDQINKYVNSLKHLPTTIWHWKII